MEMRMSLPDDAGSKHWQETAKMMGPRKAGVLVMVCHR